MVQEDEEARFVSGSSGTRSGVSNFKALLDKRRRLDSPTTPNFTVVCDRDNSYQRLPQLQTLQLSIFKLDGSSFEVEIVKNATIVELKMAIEEVFDSSQATIAWPVIWGHFCLSYKGQKLLNDKAHLRNYGIKEGDEIQFVRHMSIDCSPIKTRQKKLTFVSKKHFMLASSESSECGDTKQLNGDACDASNATCGDSEQVDIYACHASNATEDKFEDRDNDEDEEEEDQVPGINMFEFIRGLISPSKLVGFAKKKVHKQTTRSLDET